MNTALKVFRAATGWTANVGGIIIANAAVDRVLVGADLNKFGRFAARFGKYAIGSAVGMAAQRQVQHEIDELTDAFKKSKEAIDDLRGEFDQKD